MSNKGGNKREKFLESCRKQKLDTVRWSLGAGGQSPSVRDDDGYTAIMIAAAGNLHKVLRMLVDHTRKTREREQMDLRDGAGDGRTALMMAAASFFSNMSNSAWGTLAHIVWRVVSLVRL